MAYLSDIIKIIEKKCKVKVMGSCQNNHLIEGIRFLNRNDVNIGHLSPGILYLADYEIYGREELYGDVFYTGTGDSLPSSDSIYIVEKTDLIELYNIMEEAILAYKGIEKQKQNLFSILHNGYGIDSLLQTAYKYLDNQVVVCDSSYSIISAFPELKEDENIEIRNNRFTVRSRYSEDMENKKITERIYHSVYPFSVRFDDFTYMWIFESIRIKHAVVGYICVRCSGREHTEGDLELIHVLSQMVSIQLQKDDSYRNPQGIKYDMFLKDLFARHFDDEMAAEQISLLGMTPKSYYYLMALTFDRDAEKLLSNYTYIRQIMTIFPNSVTGIFGSRFITLVATDKMEGMDKKEESKLVTFLKMNNMISAVSYVFDSLSESFAYFNQCQGLLSQRAESSDVSPIVYYENNYLRHILNIVNKHSAVEASVHPSVKFMHKYDDEHGTNYISTLQSYFDNNRSAPATAEALFIHKSTLFYRFDRMKQLFNIRFDDKDALFAYEYSLKFI